MKNKPERLYKKIECTKEKMNEIEKIISILSPLVYVYKIEDIKLLERRYERLNHKLNSYKTKL